jgi:hypothetical protein
LTLFLLNTGCSKKEEDKAPEIKPNPVSTTTAPAPAPEAAPAATATSSSSSGSGGGSGGYGSGYGSSQGQSGMVGATYGAGYGTSGNSSGPSGGYGSGYGAPGGGAPPKELPPLTWMEAANKAFEKGNEIQATRFAKAAAILNTEDSSKIMESVRWSSAASRPELLTQIAVGLEVEAPKNVTEYNPIYYGIMDEPGGGGGSGGYGASYGSSGGQKPKKQKPTVRYEKAAAKEFQTELEKAAGLMATELLTSMNSAHSDGAWIPLFADKTVELKVPKKPEKSSGGSGYGGGPQGGGGYGSSYGAGYGSGGYGGGYGGNSAPIPAKNDLLQQKLEDPKDARLVPGLHYIGTGKSTELVKKAEESGYSTLIIFNVVVKENRRAQYIQNECEAKLWDLKKKKLISVSKSLKNNEVAKDMAEGKEDVVQLAMAKFLEQVRAKSLSTEIPPAIDADMIKKNRLPTLTDDTTMSGLDRLFEAYYWKSKGMLADQDYQLVAEKVLGDSAAKLSTGTEEERKEILLGLM